MLLATTAATLDKTSWPKVEALPTTLPAAARARDPKFPVYAKFSLGSYADAPKGYATRMSTDWDFSEGKSMGGKLVGSDPRAALAAAVAMAGVQHLSPDTPNSDPTPQQTLVGLFQLRSGAFWAAPIWYTPGTNDVQYFGAIDPHLMANAPESRFTFRDTGLAAVVGVDGYIRNPAHAAAALLR